jgi:lysine 2,3-aminomutase
MRQPVESTTCFSEQNFYAAGSRKKTDVTNRSKTTLKNDAMSERTKWFRKAWYPQVKNGQWNNWRWQITNRIETYEQLKQYIDLSPKETAALKTEKALFPFAVTPYYASLIDRFDYNDPLRKCVIPVTDEHLRSAEESDDPLHEDRQSPVPGIIHRYPDRVLFLVTPWCSTYCRYCTRSRMVGNHTIQLKPYKKMLSGAIEYIRSTKNIRDVLLSGGDPLTLDDLRLEWILKELRTIPHVEIIRIGTKVPVVLPQRITPHLVHTLRRFHPLWMSIHFTHPREITPEVQKACTSLADGGIPLGSQTVLLSGINDTTDVLKELFQKLMQIRVKPYYLYQCDPITGSKHFRTPVDKGIKIISELQGHTSGYAIPRYVIDAPGGGGKITVTSPTRRANKNGKYIKLTNYEGKIFFYPDTIS